MFHKFLPVYNQIVSFRYIKAHPQNSFYIYSLKREIGKYNLAEFSLPAGLEKA